MNVDAHLAASPVAVVGQRLDDDGDAAGAIALVAHGLEIGAVGAGRLLDGALDVVLGHVLGARVLDREAQARVHLGVWQAGLGRDRDFAAEKRAKARALVRPPCPCGA